jgi:hypothetical protein
MVLSLLARAGARRPGDRIRVGHVAAGLALAGLVAGVGTGSGSIGTPGAISGAATSPAAAVRSVPATTPAANALVLAGEAQSARGGGYWAAFRNGTVMGAGNVKSLGQPTDPASPIVGIAATHQGVGYWLVGYWLVGADGGVFTFGDARYHGSAAGRLGSAWVTGITPADSGYWMLSSTGHVVGFDVPSLPSLDLPIPIPRLPAAQDPATSLPPTAALQDDCFGGASAATCDAAALADIDTARAAEGYGALVLPANFESSSYASQLVDVADAERTSRGLPSLPENGVLDNLAQLGAVARADPTGPNGYTWGSNVSWGYETPLAADFGWMYDDGPGSPNVDCASAGAPGCWGHRHNILSPWGGAAGGGAVDTGTGWVFTQLFVAGF